LEINTDIARHAAALHVPTPGPLRDALVAAIALHHYMTIITRNTRDFEQFNDLRITNPWS